MAHRQYYPYPPMPQGSVPPRVTTPILPDDLTADEIPQGRNTLQTLMRWYAPAFPVRQAHSTLASLLYESLPPDDPPLKDTAALLRLLISRPVAPLPQQKANLSPLLLEPEADTQPLLPYRAPFSVIYNATYYSKRPSQQQIRLSSALLGQSDVVPGVSMAHAAFQANAFQSDYPGVLYAFQAVDNIIAFPETGIRVRDFLTIFVGPLMQEYARPSAIVIECQVLDPTYTPAHLINATSVQINLIRPDESFEVTLASMSNISTGFYRYTFQSNSNTMLGAYTMNILATNGTNVAQTITQAAFRLVAN